MKAAYLDAQGGASGDMFLGALVDAGCPAAAIEKHLKPLPAAPFRLASRAVERAGVRCTKVDVEIDASRAPPRRTLAGIRRILEETPLAPAVQAASLRVFRRFEEAESRTRGRAPEEIEIPEPDATDFLVDIAGSAAGIFELGIERMYGSGLRPGQGVNVPPPSVLRLAEGWPVLAGGPAREITTPTGAALVTTLARAEPHPPLTIERVGYGAGNWDGLDGAAPAWPNCFRLWIGTTSPWEQDVVWELATNLDNFNPEGTDLLLERLFAAGALDVFLTPILMKKSRPAHLLTAIAGGEAVEKVERVLFAETPTLGVRRTPAQREKIPRRWETVPTRYGPVRFKVAAISPAEEKAWPEFEDLRALAVRHNLPLPTVQEEALRAWRGRGSP